MSKVRRKVDRALSIRRRRVNKEPRNEGSPFAILFR